MKVGVWKKKARLALPVIVAVSLLTACSAKKDEVTPTASNSPKEASATPLEKTKIKVAIWDRGAIPAGQSYNDNFLAKYVNQEVAKIGLEIEYVPYPRAQEVEKLNTWLASGTAPDLIETYDFTLMNKFAEQGGLHPLDQLLDQYGANIKKEYKDVLDAGGLYKGVRYGIPGKRSIAAGTTMKIRKDWLDKLGMAVPKTTDELYQVLKAFKEKDPGGVGKDNVVPWALAAFSSGMKGFFFGPAFGFGIRYDGPASMILMPAGNFENGVFSSHVATPQGKELFRWMNRLYSEGLISKEFITDLNSEKFTQQLVTGVAGFVDSNDAGYSLTQSTRKTVPGAEWVEIEPFVDPNKKQSIFARSPVTMVMLSPKTSKHPDAVVKYLNWMADPANIKILKNGIEGVHYKVEDGLIKVLDQDKYMSDVRWLTNDLVVMGTEDLLTAEQYRVLYKDEPSRANSEIVRLEYAQKFGKFAFVPDTPMPFSDKNAGTIAKYLYDELTKVVIARDFEKEYQELMNGWNKVGGPEFDKEVTAVLAAKKK